MKKYIPFVTRQVSMRIPVDDIIYVLRKDRKIKFVTKKGNYDFSEKLENIDQYLDKRFYYTLKTFVINFEQVEKMEDQTIYFKNGEHFVIGRGNYIRTRQSFSAYLKGLL